MAIKRLRHTHTHQAISKQEKQIITQRNRCKTWKRDMEGGSELFAFALWLLRAYFLLFLLGVGRSVAVQNMN